MKIELLEEAIIELDLSYIYYENKVDGLGDLYLNEFVKTIKRIKSFPKAWRLFSKRTRICLFSKFPYGIVFQERNEKILIIAIVHLAQKPYYWKKRLK